MLPTIRQIAEVVALAFGMFVRLVRRNKLDPAFPAPLAGYGCRQVRAGRRFGSRLNIRDVTSPHCQQRKNVQVEAAGWALLVQHPVKGKLYNVDSDEHAQGVLWMARPLVMIDVYEHAFYVETWTTRPARPNTWRSSWRTSTGRR